MYTPKISIITVSYNAVCTIEGTILSVLNQTYDNIEYIIIDGGSTDGTIDIIQKYSNKLAYWVSELDAGIYDAMNKGIDIATGEWVYLLCAGDTLLSTSTLYNIFSNNRVADYHFVYGKVFMQDLKTTYGKKYNNYTLTRSNICQQAIFYNSIIFKTIGKHNTKYIYLADWDLNIRCFSNNSLKKYFIDEVFALYEGGGASAKNYDLNFWHDYDAIIMKNFGLSKIIINKIISFLLDTIHIRKLIVFFRKYIYIWRC